MKRLIDLSLAGVAVIVLAIPMVLIALAVRVFLGSPVLFRQVRPGWHERPFEIIKFRTMTDRRDADGGLLPDVQRLTRFGRWLRATSLDELPELLNVIRGEMSLVGPRPLLMQYLPLYDDVQRTRHRLRPGITGWAQINGRNALSWEEKFALDVWYVRNRTVLLDFRILAFTVVKLFQRDGIAAPGHATMPAFEGQRSGPTNSRAVAQDIDGKT